MCNSFSLSPFSRCRSSPKMRTSPDVGSRTPIKMFKSVLLPHPLPPRITKVSSGKTLKLIPLRTVRPFGKTFVRLTTSRIGSCTSGIAASTFPPSSYDCGRSSSNKLERSYDGIGDRHYDNRGHNRLGRRFTDFPRAVSDIEPFV